MSLGFFVTALSAALLHTLPAVAQIAQVNANDAWPISFVSFATAAAGSTAIAEAASIFPKAATCTKFLMYFHYNYSNQFCDRSNRRNSMDNRSL
jgi:hypothetical protein